MSEREHPILFSSLSICALLADQKSVTRRLSERWMKVKAGDRLWCRETWGCPEADLPGVPGGRKPEPGMRIVYRANEVDDYQWSRAPRFVWRPSIFMPRWASRILLGCEEDTHGEYLQDITEEEAKAEGAGLSRCGQSGYAMEPICSHRTGFVRIWSTLHTKPGERWEDNPTVIRVGKFRRIAQ